MAEPPSTPPSPLQDDFCSKLPVIKRPVPGLHGVHKVRRSSPARRDQKHDETARESHRLHPRRTRPDRGNEAESSCLAAVAQQAGSSEGSIISAERGENATIVLVPVPGAQAPRRCKYGATGVQRVFYTGEG